ncbi:MAG: thioredoxin [Psittacicella sp.]
MDIIHTTDNKFKDLLENTKGLVLLDMWAPWCGPCVAMGEILEDISDDRDDVQIAKLNVDDNQELAAAFGVRSIPTLIIFKDGKEVAKHIGTMPEADLNSLLDSHL